MFLVGTTFYLWREKISLTKTKALIAAAILMIGLCFGATANVSVALFGGFVVFAAARLSRNTILAKINNENDISYGGYLYAWPTTKMLYWYFPSMPIVANFALTFLCAATCGWVSWHLLEKPIMAKIRGAAKSRQFSLIKSHD
jgi:peptidoglycan/LPS O-acetylase OafA/YrhL